jgi:nucleoside-diphosphate-sugar epimerase
MCAAAGDTMSRRVFITGATGFVGRQVLRSLLDKDVTIVCAVREGFTAKLPSSPRVERRVLTSDLFAEDEIWWKRELQDIEVVIHLAWYAEPGKYQFSAKNLDCLIGTLCMARAAAAAGVRRVVGVGTCFEYQQSDRPLSVDAPLAPSSPYAACKAAAYFAMSQALPASGVEFAWCRLFYLHGEGEDSRRLVPTLRQYLTQGRAADLTSGNQVRDFLDVTEAGRRIAEVAMSGKTGAFNICSGRPVTVRELAQSIADEYGRRDLLNFGARKENPLDPPYVVGTR